MTSPQSHLKLALIALTAIILAACSSGGSDEDPVTNTAPTFSASSVSISVEENVIGVIYTAEATDAEGNTITYSLSGADQAQFSIGTSNGELQFTSSPAYDDPQDSNKDNVYEIQISASDSSASSSIAVMVTVTEAGTGGGTNQAPSVSVSGSQQVNEGTDIALSGSASDSDGSIESYQWRQLGGTTAQLGDADSAELEFSAPMVELSNDLLFELEVTDNDGATASAQITVKVNNINQQPQISASALSVDAGATKGLSIEATDPDTNDVLLYSLQQQPTAGSVSLNSTSGYLEYSAPDDGSNSDSFIVQVSDGALSSTATVQVTITQPVTNSADVEAPSAAKIVSASSLEVGVMEIFWFASSDADTADAELRYDIHVGTTADFTPDASNRLATVQEVLNARVSGLPEATDLYALIVTRDSGDNSAQSPSFAFQQASSTELVVLNDDADFATDSELRLQTAEVNDTALVLTANDQSSIPEPGQILISEEGSGYLRKVSAVEQSEGVVTVTTESASLGEVVDTAQIQDSTKLFRDVQSSYVDGTSFEKQSAFKLSASNSIIQQEKQIWAQGAFAAVTDIPLEGQATTVYEESSWLEKLFQPAAIVEGDQSGKIILTAAKLDDGKAMELKVDSEYSVEVRIEITSLGQEDQYQIDEVDVRTDVYDSTLGAVIHDSSTTDEEYDADGRRIAMTVQVGLRPFETHTEEIKVSVYAYYGDYECGTLFDGDICDKNEVETLEFTVLIIDEAPSFSGDEPIELGISMTRDNATVSAKISGKVDFDFEPDLDVRLDIEDDELQNALVQISGDLNFSYVANVEASAEYSNKDNPSVVPLNVYGGLTNERTYIRVFTLGVVPVVMETKMKFNAEAWVSVTGSIGLEQTLKFNTTAKMGMKYNKIDGWKVIDDSDADGIYTLTLIAETGIVGQVRLIPDVTINFYRVASGNLSLEPYVQGDLAISSEMQAQISKAREEGQVIGDIETFYSLEELSFLAGLECKTYVSLDVFDINIIRYPESGKKTVCNPNATIFSLPSAQQPQLEGELLPTYDESGEVSVVANFSSLIEKGDGLIDNKAKASDILWSTFPGDDYAIVNSSNPRSNSDGSGVITSSQITFTKSTKYIVQLTFGGVFTPRPWGQQIVEYELDLGETFTACYEDCDSDGIPSAWEVANGLDPNFDDAAEDPDGDGYDNLAEYLAGTDPNSSSSMPIGEELLPSDFTATAGDTQVILTWTSYSDSTIYNIYRSTDPNCDPTIANISTNCSAGATFDRVGSGFVDTGLTNATTYYYWIEAIHDGEVQLTENYISATPHETTTTEPIPGTLNDTGITWGGDYSSGNNSDCSSNISAPQDCHQGRDADTGTNDDSDGHAGFSFTRLNADGSEYTGTGVYADDPWHCVQDNVTGFIWEVKTDDGSERDKDNTYRWGGLTAIGRNNSSREGEYYEDWNSIINVTNGEQLCGYGDWRIPSVEQLRSIVNYSRTNPSIDLYYFPNTKSGIYWTASPLADDGEYAWQFYFDYGYDYGDYRHHPSHVRLVHYD